MSLHNCCQRLYMVLGGRGPYFFQQCANSCASCVIMWSSQIMQMWMIYWLHLTSGLNLPKCNWSEHFSIVIFINFWQRHSFLVKALHSKISINQWGNLKLQYQSSSPFANYINQRWGCPACLSPQPTPI